MIDLSQLDNVELQEDRISDAKWLKNSGVYTAEIDMAYMMESKNGAKGVSLHFITEEGEKFNTDIYMTNRKGEPFYYDKKKNKQPLPGMLEVMKYCKLITGDPEAFQKTEPVLYPVYDYDKKADVEKQVDSIVPLVGKVVQLVLQETVEDKTALNSGSGKYEPTGETKITLMLKTILDGATGKTLGERDAALDSKYKDIFLGKIAENPIYIPKKVVGTLPAGFNGKDSGEHKPKVNADTSADSAPFGG